MKLSGGTPPPGSGAYLGWRQYWVRGSEREKAEVQLEFVSILTWENRGMCRLLSLDKLHAVSPTYVHPVSKSAAVLYFNPCDSRASVGRAADGPETGTIHIS